MARKQIDDIIRDREKDGEQKRQEIDEIYQKLNPLLKRVVEKAYPLYLKN